MRVGSWRSIESRLMVAIVVASIAIVAQTAASPSPIEVGRDLEARNDLQGALVAYQRAVEASPRDAVARDKLGFLLGRLGRTEEALAAFVQATELDPNLFDAQYHLGAT